VSSASNTSHASTADSLISQTQAQVSSTMLHSSATLGSGQLRTHAQRREHEEDREVRKALDGSSRSRKRRRISRNANIPDESDDDSDGDLDEHIAAEQTPFERAGSSAPAIPVMPPPSPQEIRRVSSPSAYVDATGDTSEKPPLVTVNSSVGSGLKRHADGTVVAPHVMPRRPKPSREVRTDSSLTLQHTYTICVGFTPPRETR
jgi:ATP-dependent RNA helicase DHX37/DHR1